MRRLWYVFLLVMLAACGSTEVQRELPTQFILPIHTPAPTVASNSEHTQKALTFWEAASGELQTDGADTWTFEATAGDQVAVRALGYGIEPMLKLSAPDGRVLDSGQTVAATLPESAVYTVEVTTLNGAHGRYEIGLSYSDRPHPNESSRTFNLPEIVGVPTPAPASTLHGKYIGPLTPEETIGRMVEAGEADHLYTFDGHAGTYIRIEMNRVSGEIVPRLTLYGPDARPIATDGGSGEQGAVLRNILIEHDGLFTIRASSIGEGGYSIRLLEANHPSPVTPTVIAVETATPIPTLNGPTPSPPPPGNLLEAGHQFEDFIPEAGLTAVYTLVLRAGEIITTGAIPYNEEETGLRLAVELIDLAGETIAGTSHDDGSAVLSIFEPPAAGTYRLNVTAIEGSGTYLVGYDLGEWWLEMLRGPAPRDERLEESLGWPGTRDLWTVELREGDIITAAVNPVMGSPVHPVLAIALLEEPDTPIALDANSGGERSPYIRSLTIPASGLYLMSVYDQDGGAAGGYALIWRYVNVAPTATPPPAHAPVLTLDDNVTENEYRFYTFHGYAGQQIEVRIEAADGSDIDPVAALIDPEGALLIEVDDVGEDLNPVFRVELPMTGTYAVRVNGYLSGGDFSVKVQELF